jgi:hypothetical protein
MINMKKYIIIILGLIASILVQAQNPQFEWVKTNQGYQGDANSYYIQTDSLDNIYSIGEFTGSIDFNPSPSQAYWLTSTTNKLSYYIQKLDSNGNFVWVRQIDFESGSKIYQFSVGVSGNLYITGSYEDSVDIDPGTANYMLHSHGYSDGFILKLSANGNFIWAKSFGGSRDDYFRDICIDKHENVYTHGSFKDTVDFDPGLSTSTYIAGNDAFILKLDKNGDFVWAKTFHASEGYSDGIALDLDKEGNVYCVGNFFGNGLDFDPGTGTVGPPTNSSHMYFVKLDSLGNFVWARFNTYVNIGGYSMPNTMAVDRNSNIFITGYSHISIDFDPGPDTLFLKENTFIEKYDQNGNFLWAKSYGYGDEPMALAADTFGNVYTAGYFSDSTDLDPGPGSLIFYAQGSGLSGYGASFQKLNSSGNLLMAGIIQSNIGLPNWARGRDLCIDSKGNIIATGEYGGTVDFDIVYGVYNQTSINNRAASYLLKLSQCKTITTDNQTTCDSLTWMDGVTYYKSTNSAYFTLPSSAGCDSVICLNLTVPVIDTTITVSTTGIFSSNQGTASYQWLDCNNGLSPLTGETLQNFTPTANGSYAVALDVSGCVDTSACVSIQNVGVEEIEGYIINLFPNPATTQITLDLGAQNQIFEILNVFTITGQKVLILNNVQSNKPIDIQNLKSGVYLVEGVLESGERFVGKFVKE